MRKGMPPGACAFHLGLTSDAIKKNHASGHVCWDDNDIIDGKPTGAVRVSFGWMSSFEDLHKIQEFIVKYFVEVSILHAAPLHDWEGRNSELASWQGNRVIADSQRDAALQLSTYSIISRPRLIAIYVYPVKSLAPMRVDAWPVGNAGLLHDRQWAVLSEDGRVLTQKRVPSMSLITPFVDLTSGVLTLNAPTLMEKPLLVKPPGMKRLRVASILTLASDP